MSKLLVVGGSGLLGASLVLAARGRGHDVISTHKEHPIRFVGVPSINFDATKEQEIMRIFSNCRFDWVINCAALTDVDKCETDKSLARELNVDLPGRLAYWSRK